MIIKDKEACCEQAFDTAGQFWHLWTPENFEIIFTCDDDFKAGMTIMGICAKLLPRLRIITFELMSNHIHITACGSENDLELLFDQLKKMLKAHFKFIGRQINWNHFIQKHRELITVDEARNVIAYNNRNGYVISNLYTPYSYPWGANRYYFNNDSKQLALQNSENIGLRERRLFSHSRIADPVINLSKFDGYASPLSFCDIELGEALFRSPVHYFSRISKCVESDIKIAKEIGDSIFYTDDELFSAILKICKCDYGCKTLSDLPVNAKIEVAKRIHYDYHATAKQLRRMLKLDSGVLASLGIG